MSQQKIVTDWVGGGGLGGPTRGLAVYDGLRQYCDHGWRVKIAEPLGGQSASVLFQLKRSGEGDVMGIPETERMMAACRVDVPSHLEDDPPPGGFGPAEFEGLAELMDDGWQVVSARPFAQTGDGEIAVEINVKDPKTLKTIRQRGTGSAIFLFVLEK